MTKVEALAGDQSATAMFFYGGCRSFLAFAVLFDAVVVLRVDTATPHRRLDRRPHVEWGTRPAERRLIERLHRSGEDTPDGITIDATMPLAHVVDEILALVVHRDPRSS